MGLRGTKLKFETPEAMQEVLDAYFLNCDTQEKKYSYCGLGRALGFRSRQSLLNYKARAKAFRDVLDEAKFRLEEQIEERLDDKEFATKGVIFNLTNNFGWIEKKEIDNNIGGKDNSPIQVVMFGNPDGNSEPTTD